MQILDMTWPKKKILHFFPIFTKKIDYKKLEQNRRWWGFLNSFCVDLAWNDPFLKFDILFDYTIIN